MLDKKAHWEAIYQKNSNQEVSWYQKKPRSSLELIHNTQIAPNEAIIDVGGGASVLVDNLYKEGYTNLAVLDISAKALACAKHRFANDADKIAWYESDITQFHPPHWFSLWHDRAVFHFLTEKIDRENYIKVLKTGLKRGGHLIIAAFAIGGPGKCSGLDIVQYDAEKLMSELGSDFELLEERCEGHITPANQEQKFIYFHCIRKT